VVVLGADCLHMAQLMPLHPKTPLSLASFRSRLVLSFWYRFTQVFLEKRPLNWCSVVVVVLKRLIHLLYMCVHRCRKFTVYCLQH